MLKNYFGALLLKLTFAKWFSRNIPPPCGFQKVQSTKIFVEMNKNPNNKVQRTELMSFDGFQPLI